jgi:uncharacterized protein (TIGR02118 family)
MVSYFVRYRGSSTEPEKFLRYYETRHADVLRSFPGIRGLTLHTAGEWHDPFPVQRAGSLLLAQMTFDSAADLDRALQSQARRDARDDFGRFPPFTGEVTHEAMTAKVIF